MMRITIIDRYFWPDTPPYAIMLHDMTRWFAEAGHNVEVITAQPSYKSEAGVSKQPWQETVDGVRIRRLWLLAEKNWGFVRILNAGLFIALASACVLFGRKRDIVWTTTMPPVLQAFAISVAGRMRGSRFLYHMMDIYPEIGIASKTLTVGWMTSMLKKIDTFTLNHTAVAVVLSRDMANVLKERGACPHNVAIINNFALTEDGDPPDRPVKSADGPVRFVFAGNIGRFQNLEALVHVFGDLDGDAVLELVGDGRAKADLQKIVCEKGFTNIRFLDHKPVAEAFAFIKTCDVGVVSLSRGLYRYAFPSKIMTYLAAGIPILAMVEPESDIARLLIDRQLGQVADWNEGADSVGHAISQIIKTCNQGAWQTHQSRDVFHPEVARRRWLHLLKTLDGRESST